MTLWQAMALGFLQGVTEFLPISSSGHLVLAESFFGLQVKSLLVFDVTVHAGTLIALLVFFRRDLVEMTKAFFAHLKKMMGSSGERWVKTHPSDPASQTWFLIVATVPIVFLAPFLKDVVEDYFRDPAMVIGMLGLTAVLLAIAEVMGRRVKTGMDSSKTALMMGLFQVLAVIPGVSRSGSTMVGGLLGGLERRAAARFAFLMAVPAIGGATVFLLKDFFDPTLGVEVVSGEALAVGFVTSMLASFACMYGMLEFLRKRSLWWFVAYLVVVNVAWLFVSSE